MKTRNATEILERLTGDDPELRAMIAEETVNAQVARLIYEARTAAGLTVPGGCLPAPNRRRCVSMEINLAELREMHPQLPEDLVLMMTVRAALGLQRNGHVSPVDISLEVERIASRGLLVWLGSDLTRLEQHDSNRVTEDGAEAVVLALAHRARGWRVVRRLQRGDHADWLLEELGEGPRQVVALEVSGVDRGSIAARLADKLEQVALSDDVDQRWAGVVGFEEPVATLRSTEAMRS